MRNDVCTYSRQWHKPKRLESSISRLPTGWHCGQFIYFLGMVRPSAEYQITIQSMRCSETRSTSLQGPKIPILFDQVRSFLSNHCQSLAKCCNTEDYFDLLYTELTMFPETWFGKIDASTTLKFCTPLTRNLLSTASPMAQLPQG